MKQTVFLLLLISIFSISCKKDLSEYEGNNVPYEVTEFELQEEVTLVIPNSSFNFNGVGNCLDLGVFGPINYEAFVPTQNPNPYASLVYDIRATSIQMDLTNIPSCDFGMLQDVEVYLTDSSVTAFSQFILQDPNNPTAPHNAVKIGDLMTIADGNSTIFLDVNPDAVLDQFIHNESFKTYTNMNFDKAFTESEAVIKTTMTLSVKLINEN